MTFLARIPCIQTKGASPEIVELPIYFPNIYDLFTLFSFNCELQSKESGLSLEQIIGQGNFRKISIYDLKQIIKEDNRV